MEYPICTTGGCLSAGRVCNNYEYTIISEMYLHYAVGCSSDFV